MDSDQSYSSDSNSSSGSSSASSDGEEEVLEPVKLLGHTFELPQDLCEDYAIFKEFFSLRTWDSLLDKHKDHLRNFLPKFPGNDEEEKEKTIKMLFNREPFHFTSPLNDFYNNLKQGNYRPDIAKMRKFLFKARTKQQRHKIKSYYAKLLPEVLISRERLLAAVKSAPPGPAPYLPLLPPKPSAKNNYRPPHIRARQRYFEELAAIRSEVGGDESDDENYPEGPPSQPMKRKTVKPGQNTDVNISGTLGGNDPASLNSLECLKNVLAAHRARRQYRDNHPELNTTGITLDDIKQRVALVNGAKKLMFGGPRTSDTPIQKLRRGSKKETAKHVKASESKQTPKIKEEVESIENKPLLPNIKVKCEQEESDSESSSFVDPVSSPRPSKQRSPDLEIKQEVVDLKYPDSTNIKYMDNKIESIVKKEPPDNLCPNSKTIQPVPIKLEDLDGIDMMALPVELADDIGEVVPNQSESLVQQSPVVDPDESLTETTYANFLCLVRALFPAKAAHRASKTQLHARCAAVMRSPIAPLNTWYNQSEDWCAELDSALDFLAGERGPHPDDFVPYLQFVTESQMYQWIGAGRDCDAILGRLCERWLRAVSPLPSSSDLPPPRYPTSWIVRAPTAAEVADFMAQERRRFASASKPFTYVQHGYRSVVGPAASGGSAAGVVTGGTGPLAARRPRHASFVALARDAVARLPNGEGTSRDILTLLKMSQYISTDNEQVLLSALSAALDRLHSMKRDPVVKYDQRTAMWTYLHRNRTEEDWLKSANSRNRSKATNPSAANNATSPMLAKEVRSSTPSAMDMEVAVEEIIENASDSDVDVDGSSDTSSVSYMSSAQLLRQATQANQAKELVTTPKQTKGKLVPVPAKPQPPKQSQSPKQVQPKPQIKQVKTVVQSPKPQSQAPKPKQPIAKPNTAQAVKQAAQIAKHIAQTKAAAQTQIVKPTTPVVPQSKSPLAKQRPLQKTEVPKMEPIQVPSAIKPEVVSSSNIQTTISVLQTQNKLAQGTRSLLLRPPAVQTTVTAATPVTPQGTVNARRGVVRVLSPATPSSGKSLISPRALMTQTNATAIKKRSSVQSSPSVTTVAQTTAASTSVVSSAPTIVSSSMTTRTVQLAGGRTVQLAANQTVHLPTGQAVQLASGHTIQLSSLQLPSHSVRLPSGQTVQLATPQTVRAVTTAVKSPNPRAQQVTPTTVLKPNTQTNPTSQSTVQIPVSAVQIGGQTVQIGGQSVQLTGHTVKLPSGQSVQVASQSVQLPTQSVQLSNGQTVQLASGQNIQTVQLAGQNVLSSGQSVQIPSGQSVQIGSQTVQLAGQTVQLAGGQTVQLPNGQTIQLSSGQTVQLSNGQTLQLSGQTVQLSNQGQAQKTAVQHVVRNQTTTDKGSQPIVAKLLTNAQGQMISLEGVVGGARTLQLQGVRPQGQKTIQTMQGVSGVRVVSAAGARVTRPLILTAAKPLTNIILQQSDGSAIRVTSSGGATSSQAIVISNIGAAAATTSTTASPVLKLQQVNTLQQVKLPQGLKIQQAGGMTAAATSSGAVRSVLMDGQQLKLVGGRHVLARLLRPNQPPQ